MENIENSSGASIDSHDENIGKITKTFCRPSILDVHGNSDEDDEDVIKMNAVKIQNFLPRKNASELQINRWYQAKEIKTVKTQYGNRLVIVSRSFQIFLPQRYADVKIKSPKETRFFKITGFGGTGSQKTPKFVFASRTL